MKFFKCSPLTWIYLQTFRLGLVLHIASNASDEVQTPLPEFLEEMPGDIAFVAYDPALQRGCHGVEGFAIIRIARCDFDRHDFAFVVDDHV